jgi:CubicO group peptidase (beta-lactamase class C family)
MVRGDWEAVAQELELLTGTGGFSGSVLVSRGDETLLEFCGGLADRASGTRIHPGTRFGLASLSKPFTAAAVLSCVRDGLVRVTDRVVDVLPAQRRPRSMPDAVTVHDLLSHTSGLGDYAEEDEELPGYVADYGALWRDLPAYRMERPDDFLPLYDDAAPVAAPGTEFHYCNAGYVLLGAVLEELTGEQFVPAVTERVLRPAGMASSGYFRSDEPVPDVALGYLPRSGPDDPWRSNVFSVPVIGGGDGGAHATPRDIDRFFRSIASGGLLGDELSAAMRSRHAVVDEETWLGYGLFVLGDGTFSHGGGDPGVETGARYLPEQDRTMVILCNGEGMLDPAWDLVESAL